MKKLLLAIGLYAFLVSCGDDTVKSTDTGTVVTSSPDNNDTKTSGNLLADAGTLQKAEDALKALPKFQGKTVHVFQDVHFYEDGRIMIELQDPDKPENIDHYEFKNGKWSEPQPVQISGDGDMKANTTPLSDIKFATVATIYKNWNEKAAGVEGAQSNPLTHVYFSLFVPNQSRKWHTSGVDGTREKYAIEYNMDGSIKEFKKS